MPGDARQGRYPLRMPRPRIGMTTDIVEGRFKVAQAYASAVVAAGGMPILLPCIPGMEEEVSAECDGFIFTGGDDPTMEPWGEETHAEATAVDQRRQAFETTLLTMLECDGSRPVLGVCLGMQWMGLIAGGSLDQHLPDRLDTADMHLHGEHMVQGTIGEAVVHSHHHQALSSTGSLEVVGRAEDGIIEAVRDPGKPWWVGVQWHPERTTNEELGQRLFQNLVEASGCVRQ